MKRRLLLIRLVPMLLLTGADLTIVKSSAVVSDPVNLTFPKRVPGSVVDYTINVTNPNGALTTVNGIAITDAVPANTDLRVADLGLLNTGPIVFTDGLLPPSLLAYSFSSLGSGTDRLDFSRDNGATWTYTPVADGNGYDRQVTNIRVRLGGNQVAGSSFSLRFRVRVR